MQKKKSKKWIILLIVLGVIVTLIICFILYARKKAEELLTEMSSVETALVEKRDLVSSISATGKVVSVETRTVKSVLSGVTVTELPVKVGDKVAEGDLICAFDTRRMENSLETAENTKEETGLSNRYNETSAAEELRDAMDAYNRDIVTLQMEVDLKQRDFETAGNELEKAKQKFQQDPTPENSAAADTAYTKSAAAYTAYQEAINHMETQKVELLEAIEKAQYNLEMAGMKSGNDTTGAAVEDASIDLENATVTAPTSGTITSVSVAKGDTYGGGAIVTIEDENDLEVASQISEYDIPKVKTGQKAVIRTNATGDQEFTGKVVKVAPKATTASSSSSGTSLSSSSQDVTYEVRISLDQKNQDLKLDMTAKVSIITEEKKDVLTVPYDAVQTDEEGNFFVEILKEPEETDTESAPAIGKTDTESAPAVETETVPADEKGEIKPSPGNEEAIPEQLRPLLSERKRIPVEKGIESAYYIEVITDDLPEGTEVVVPDTADSFGDIFEVMGRRGPMGGI